MAQPILDEQIAYYRARAHEYDEWFYRQGRYDHGAELNQQWFAEAEAIKTALLNLPPVTTALELACGTGIWTQELIKVAQQVIALDASPEMLAINQAKVQSERVTYQQVDLFTWQPDRQYDLIFFGFWLSHVPPEQLNTFLSKIRRALTPTGTVFLIDSRKVASSTGKDMALPAAESVLVERKLNDGRTFKIIKVFYEPLGLTQEFSQAGLQANVQTTAHYFIWATANLAAD